MAFCVSQFGLYKFEHPMFEHLHIDAFPTIQCFVRLYIDYTFPSIPRFVRLHIDDTFSNLKMSNKRNGLQPTAGN